MKGRRARLEYLEDRRYLSGSPPELGQFELNYAETALVADLVAAPSDDQSRAIADSIYAALKVQDLGDHYWSGGEKVSLWRADDEVVISVGSAGESTNAIDALFGDFGLLKDLKVAKELGEGRFILSKKEGASLPSLDLATIKNVAGIEWAAPLFTFGEEGSWFAINNEIIVALNAGTSAAEFFATPEFSGFRPLLGTPDQFVGTLTMGDGLDTLDAANRLHSDPRVAWAAPNGSADFQPAAIPNDSLFSSQWHLNNTSQLGAKADADSDLAEAWNTTTGNTGVVIAVIDDGVQTNHPDLNIFTNSGEIAGNSIDDDGNGWIDDVNGWNFGAAGLGNNNVNPTHQNENHGTAVAGVAGARGNNAIGVSGSAQNVRILPVKIALDGVLQNFDRIATAVYYAAGRTADGSGTWDAADILNASFGAGGLTSHPAADAAFNWASTSGRSGLGATTFAAAGNSAAGRQGSGTEQYSPITADSSLLTGAQTLFQTFGAATWSWVVSYAKDASGIAGEDTLRLGRFINDDGANTRWDSTTAPAGWSLTPFVGQDGWVIEDNPSRAHGTGRYQARATAIGNNDTAFIMAPAISVSSANPVMSNTLYAWRSSATTDRLKLSLFNHNTSLLYAVGQIDGQVPTLSQSIDVAVAYPANLASNIAVGASTDWDYRSHYSQFGTALDLVAPSGGGYANITTTDRTGTAGYNTTSGTAGDYTPTFSGTSSATPLTAGVAALLLTKNPHLTPTQVRNALQNSADKVGGNNGATAYVGGFNQYYGFGRLNAAAALAATPTDTIAPKVSNVIISGSTSTHAPHSFNGPDDNLDSDGSGNQLRTVPVGGADTVSVQFSEDMVNVTSTSLTLWGLKNSFAPTIAVFTPFDPVTMTASWKFSAPFDADQYLLSLTDAVTDVAGNLLDGEWTNPFSRSTTSTSVSEFPSGNDTAGGDFNFVYTILPGDANRTNTVNGLDFFIYQQNPGGPGRTFNQADYNGDGDTDSADNALWQANNGNNFTELFFADYNGNGIVDGDDNAIWQMNNGATNATHGQGDANNDNKVDGLDYLLWQRQFGLQLDWVA